MINFDELRSTSSFEPSFLACAEKQVDNYHDGTQIIPRKFLRIESAESTQRRPFKS